MRSHHITIPRTGRYVTLGPEAGAREVWFVLHGYGQLAADFAGYFGPLDDGTRLFVAPEALSRFYHQEGRGPVGASWMTREDREHEITDYVRYLDLVYERIFAGMDRDGVRVLGLGFSQGVAAVSRWAATGRARLDELILWQGNFPPEIDPAQAAGLRGPGLTVVGGTRDAIVPESSMAALADRLAAAGLRPAYRTFSGGHRLDRATLSGIAARTTPP